ncbi:hypothetical protein E2C01_095590 [Portunus trituberculatus]|uniref:Uncharacterized protein n=1 Tax=Portunus trituberculatus TaxID=210409 RepID=A0A5B7K0Q5_PORTR|nr:hypothetical protein [Portunus trituberculatus]
MLFPVPFSSTTSSCSSSFSSCTHSSHSPSCRYEERRSMQGSRGGAERTGNLLVDERAAWRMNEFIIKT